MKIGGARKAQIGKMMKNANTMKCKDGWDAADRMAETRAMVHKLYGNLDFKTKRSKHILTIHSH